MLHGNKIHDVEIQSLEIFSDERGSVKKMVSISTRYFEKFGEIYFSTVNPGIIKGWKRHSRITQLMCVARGMVKIVIVDLRQDSPTIDCTQTLEFGDDNYVLLKIPPGVWYSFSSLVNQPSIIANCISEPHDPRESETIELTSDRIPYKWN
jgi:dTDP-4-dehydrorhamnose 3,5-epimerase